MSRVLLLNLLAENNIMSDLLMIVASSRGLVLLNSNLKFSKNLLNFINQWKDYLIGKFVLFKQIGG
jgi:hypothetical protein